MYIRGCYLILCPILLMNFMIVRGFHLKMTGVLLQFAVVISIAVYSHAANILYVIPFSAPSHYIALRSIGLELAAKGHNVTAITPKIEKDHPKSYHQILTDEVLFWDLLGGEKPNVFTMVDLSTEDFHKNILWLGGPAYTEVALNSTSVQEFLKKDNQFDVVISEIFFFDAFYALANKYNAPLVLVSTFGNCMRQNFLSRNPLQQATVVSEYLHLEDPESFWGRLRNFYFTIYEYFGWRFSYLKHQEALVQKYLPDLPQQMPSLYEIAQNASLVLYNGHFSFDGPVAYLPNIVEIGGIHITDSNKTLPKDLEDILNNAKYGVVYVNFGSNVQSSELPKEKRDAFLNAFGKLKQTVIWKWEDDSLENQPRNVIIRKWFPQNEMLKHPNVKVFIGHGGLLGTQEAVYHGVPIIGVPVYADQYNNLLLAQNKGFGRILQYQHITEENLSKILNDFLKDDTYQKKAKEASRRFKDRPMTPLDTAIYWIEYVIRNNGAEHIKNPALKLKWIEYAMLDVYAFVLMIILSITYIIVKIVTVLTKYQSKPKSIPQKKKFKKKD